MCCTKCKNRYRIAPRKEQILDYFEVSRAQEVILLATDEEFKREKRSEKKYRLRNQQPFDFLTSSKLHRDFTRAHNDSITD